MPDRDRCVLRIRGALGTPRTRLICFSYAGGSPEGFRAWTGELAPEAEVIAVRLRGHGSRIRERPHADWSALVEETFSVLAPHLAEPHCLYGHSFGGRLAYELAHRAEAEYPGATRRLFVSGCRSPDRPQRRPYMHDRCDAGFRLALREMGGTPSAIIDHEPMMKALLPTMREEIRLAELWDDRHGTGVDAPITAVYGRDDPIDDRAAMSGWPRFSRRTAEVLAIPGGHFFLESHRQELIAIINPRLAAASA